MFPLNIGFVGSYAEKTFAGKIEVKLFKYPNVLLGVLKKSVPDVIGFSNYAWNADLNNQMAGHIKKISPKTIVVFGGPNIGYDPGKITRSTAIEFCGGR